MSNNGSEKRKNKVKHTGSKTAAPKKSLKAQRPNKSVPKPDAVEIVQSKSVIPKHVAVEIVPSKSVASKPARLEFQIIDWRTYHEIDEDECEIYRILLFGRTMDDKDVCLKIKGFQPYFYIRIPDSWQKTQIDIFIEFLKNRVKYKTENNPKYDYNYSDVLVDHKVVKKHDFYGFVGKAKCKFLQLFFKSHAAMKEYSYTLSYPLKIAGLSREPVQYYKYESNLEPHIRFMHTNNLSSCGWVRIDGKKLTATPKFSACECTYEVDWQDVLPAPPEYDTLMAPLKIMGYDIECISCDHNFPQATRKTDKIIQIGMTIYRYGKLTCAEKHILVLKGCTKITGANVECYNSEKKLLRGFAKKFAKLRPDFMAGYNNFGFDDSYIFNRVLRIDQETAAKRGIKVEHLMPSFESEFLTLMGKLNNEYIKNSDGVSKSLTTFEKKNLSSSALGDNELLYFDVPGIVSIDVMKVIMRDHKLTGYKLDNVSANFITEGVKNFIFEKKDTEDLVTIYTKSTKALDVGSFVQIMVNDGYSSSPLRENAKYKVLDIGQEGDGETLIHTIKICMDSDDVGELKEVTSNPLLKIFWTFAKDDMHHTNINKYFNEGNPKKIRQIAKYCLKDCMLVNLLLAKLEIIINNIGMAKVCNVPLSYLFLRGQGVKIFSLVSKECRLQNYVIPVLQRKNKDADNDADDKYEGATVIKPIPGVYTQPIAVLDFNSLYPNSIREGNMSQETFVDGKKYNDLPGYKYHHIEVIKKDKKGRITKDENGNPVKNTYCFAEEEVPEGAPRKYGILPYILTTLLDARKATNNKLGVEKDPSVRIALNGLQLAYKITANSLYGQTGAPTSPLYFRPIAESTTSIGRVRLYSARSIVEKYFPGSKIIYGDTDSIFIDFGLKDENGNRRTDVTALEETIKLAQQAADKINSIVPNPQRIVYEKTMHPFILITKKKYVGLLYGEKTTSCYLMSMGIVLKRRDNAPIVKIIVGGIIDQIVKTKDIGKALDYAKIILRKLMDGKYPMDKFILSKALKAKYKKPGSIAHKVLADRMGVRDPGNKPQINDRIQYVYVVKEISARKKKDIKQGELIENPEYVVKNNLKIDYLYYLEHQIIKPASQILELMMPAKKVTKFFRTYIYEELAKRKKAKSLNNWLSYDNVDDSFL